jgi:hypothetical protein
MWLLGALGRLIFIAVASGICGWIFGIALQYSIPPGGIWLPGRGNAAVEVVE